LPHPAPAEVVTKFNAAWGAGDIDAALSLIADDAVYELHISNEVLPFGGEAVGRDAIETALQRIRADWDYILYRPLALAGVGDIVRFQVEFMYRHRASGQVLNGRFRLVMRIEDGLIKRADEYHDRAKVEAFMRMVGGSEPP
jgi:ketosteroid isomerase-like protein